MSAVLDRLAGFAGTIITPESADYAQAARTAMASGAPSLVLRPVDAADVGRAVRFAAASGLPLAVRGGGHSIAGFSTVDGGVVIDLRGLDAVELIDERRVRVGGGAVWRQVVDALAPYGLAISSGDTADVGVGGLTLSGGIGWMVRRDGLTLDHLRAVEVVTASGEVIVADAEHHAELFWALRGGGGAFGVVSAFEFEAQPVGTVAFATLTFPNAQAEAVVETWGRFMSNAPRGIGSMLTLSNPMAGGREAPVEVVFVRSDGESLDEALAALRSAASPLTADVRDRPYAEVLHPGAELPAGLRACARNGFVRSDQADAALAAVTRIARQQQPAAIVLHALGGALTDVPTDATAFAHRAAALMITTFAVAPDAALGAVRTRLAEVWHELVPHTAGVYANSLDASWADAAQAIYPPEARIRLAQVKSTYDAENLFSRSFGAASAR